MYRWSVFCAEMERISKFLSCKFSSFKIKILFIAWIIFPNVFPQASIQVNVKYCFKEVVMQVHSSLV